MNLILWTFINYYHLTALIKIQQCMWKVVVDGGTLILHIPIYKQRNNKQYEKKAVKPDWPEDLDW